MKTGTIGSVLEITGRLKAAKIFYRLSDHTETAIMIEVASQANVGRLSAMKLPTPSLPLVPDPPSLVCRLHSRVQAAKASR